MRASTEQGLTLIEMVIVVAVLGVMVLIAGRLVSDAIQTRQRSMHYAEHYVRLGQAMMNISRDLQNAYISRHFDCDDPKSQTLFKTTPTSYGERLDFTSFGAYATAADEKKSDQNEVGFFVDTAPNKSGEISEKKRTYLIRREQAPPDDDALEGGSSRALATGIEEIDFSFYDPREDRWEDEWDTTSSEFAGRLPRFVKIELKANNPEGIEEVFITKTRIFLERALSLTGIGAAQCPLN